MPLKDALNGLLNQAEGALAAYIMAKDGIAIDEVIRPGCELDLQLLTVEYASVVREIRRTVEVVKAGGLEEVVITSGSLLVVVRILNEELFVALILGRDGNLGKARYLLRLKSFSLLHELG